MNSHLRANLVLVVGTLLLSSIAYPLVVWLASFAFPAKAKGSIVNGADGKPVGSLLIAQEFKGDEYFQPRPSAAGYNASASSGSNWGANNPKLRDRVARQLGPMVKYRKGQPVGPDVEKWFHEKLDRLADWAERYPVLAAAWVTADPLNAEYVTAWQTTHKAEVEQWIKDNPNTPEPKPEDLAVPFFKSFASTYPGAFPDTVEGKTPQGETEKRIEPVKEGATIQGVFFDMWLQEHKDADLEPVPADLVTASGTGLDPHLTLRSALYQLDRVAGKWAELTKGDAAQLRKEIEEILNHRAEAPLNGLVGEKLVNVLEVNLVLRDRYAAKKVAGDK